MSDSFNIREQIFLNNDTKRIVMKINTDRLDPHDHRNSAKRILENILPNWEEDNRVNLLAVEVFHDRTYMAFDINHVTYDFHTAHLDKTILPVYLLRWIHQGRHWALIRLSQEDDDRLCTRLADLHEDHGYDVELPIVEDHTSIIVHANPRSLVR
ncbi:hypothetical protein AbraIFM66951_008497 [Aspergillus brasiliensis]|uniref:Uncharacterized protein n=1 Tax=Aspergillus brasiliensis TaxID=319629 RepID=A0A9W6DNU5_9EURO|nr:hypothetical protein AbraCBS73388_009834 [Aspergillus brasiliensis]GKZ45803.1 hypothetical protein AbraIFM66951_008497 [Aspergillus brasiliensis]